MSTRSMAIRVPVAITLLGMVAGPATVHADRRAEAVLAQLGFSDSEQKEILAGELVTKTSREQTSNRELAITMVFLIDKPPPDLVAMFQAASGYKTDKAVTAYGELHGDGS